MYVAWSCPTISREFGVVSLCATIFHQGWSFLWLLLSHKTEQWTQNHVRKTTFSMVAPTRVCTHKSKTMTDTHMQKQLEFRAHNGSVQSLNKQKSCVHIPSCHETTPKRIIAKDRPHLWEYYKSAPNPVKKYHEY